VGGTPMGPMPGAWTEGVEGRRPPAPAGFLRPPPPVRAPLLSMMAMMSSLSSVSYCSNAAASARCSVWRDLSTLRARSYDS
jgi:hypothetical protein